MRGPYGLFQFGAPMPRWRPVRRVTLPPSGGYTAQRRPGAVEPVSPPVAPKSRGGSARAR